MSKLRLGFLLLIIGAGAWVVYILFQKKAHAPLGISFSPGFQLLGKSTKALNTALTRILPINEMDEKAYGDAIAAAYLSDTNEKDTDYVYLNKLLKNLSTFSNKGFTYRAYVIPTPMPNAFALPGGIICVTKGLLNTLTSEAQVISVLSHEMGHVERGHCFEAIKYELLFKKIKASSVGQLADFCFNVLLRHSYSKTQENDADEYGYDLLLLTNYNPMAFSGAFSELQKAEGNFDSGSGNILSDYLKTHPPLPLRILKFKEMATEWWKENQGNIKRYNGIKNLNLRIPLTELPVLNEWIMNN